MKTRNNRRRNCALVACLAVSALCASISDETLADNHDSWLDAIVQNGTGHLSADEWEEVVQDSRLLEEGVSRKIYVNSNGRIFIWSTDYGGGHFVLDVCKVIPWACPSDTLPWPDPWQGPALMAVGERASDILE